MALTKINFKLLSYTRQNQNRLCGFFSRRKSDSSRNDPSEVKDKQEVSLPPEPTSCCMTGCPNCVWIQYAQQVAQLLDNGDVIAKNKIKEKVKDPQLRAYLFTQLGLKEYE